MKTVPPLPGCGTAEVPEDDFEVALPSAEALLAGTLALMTGVAQHPLKGMQPLKMRQLMAAKVVSNLFFLAEHPHCSAPFRTTLLQLRVHWQRIACPDATARADEAVAGAPWHPAPATVQ